MGGGGKWGSTRQEKRKAQEKEEIYKICYHKCPESRKQNV